MVRGVLRILGLLAMAVSGSAAGFYGAAVLRSEGPAVAADGFVLKYLGREYSCTLPAQPTAVGPLVRVPTSEGGAWFMEWRRSARGRPVALYKEVRPGELRSCFGPQVNLGIAFGYQSGSYPHLEVKWDVASRVHGQVRAVVSVRGAHLPKSIRVPVALLTCKGTRDILPISMTRKRRDRGKYTLYVTAQAGNDCAGMVTRVTLRFESRDLYFLSSSRVLSS
jgi:hypothetical protein